jgi:hypothetical protein
MVVDIYGDKDGYIDRNFDPNILIDNELDIPIEKLARSELWYMEEHIARRYGFEI